MTISFPIPNRIARKRSTGAFTLTELLVVLAVLAILGVTLLPVLAGTKRNSKLAQCLDNLRQIHVGCTIYAGDFADWYPITTVGAGNPYGTVNNLSGIVYTRYSLYSGQPDGTVMPRNYLPAWYGKAPSTSTMSDENLGYLYAGKVVPDGHTFYCPSWSGVSPTSPGYLLSAEYYSSPQFISVQSLGSVRSSYIFNPRIKYAGSSGYNIARKYQKSTAIKMRDVFALDWVACQSSGIGVPFTPDYWAHWPGQGLDVCYTDGSAKLATLTPTQFRNIVNLLTTDESQSSALKYDTVFNYLLNSP
ncbi:MAG TPA: type II secretion system protein [Verrucomicrobiae bacterium]|nr:type II secretion system protein [Verrucomicrobiae bacterium]